MLHHQSTIMCFFYRVDMDLEEMRRKEHSFIGMVPKVIAAPDIWSLSVIWSAWPSEHPKSRTSGSTAFLSQSVLWDRFCGLTIFVSKSYESLSSMQFNYTRSIIKLQYELYYIRICPLIEFFSYSFMNIQVLQYIMHVFILEGWWHSPWVALCQLEVVRFVELFLLCPYYHHWNKTLLRQSRGIFSALINEEMCWNLAVASY